MSRVLKILGIAVFLLGLLIWKAWPKAKPIPMEQRSRLIVTQDIVSLFSDSLHPIKVLPMDSLHYHEISATQETLYSASQKIGIDGASYFFATNYQRFSSVERAVSQEEGNRLTGRVPGVATSKFKVSDLCDDFEMHTSSFELDVLGRCRSTIIRLSLRPKDELRVRFDTNVLARVLRSKLDAIHP